VNGLDPANPTFTRAHIPGLRLTQDGRIGVKVEERVPAFSLITPEKLTQPILRSPASAYTMSSTSWSYLNGNSNWNYLRNQFAPGDTTVLHACLWDDTPPTAQYAGSTLHDVYDIKVLVTANTTTNGTRHMRLHVTPVQIWVSNPKTAAATITQINRTGPTTSSPPTTYDASGFEPVICGDGRLLILRIFANKGSGVQWTNPNTSTPEANRADIVYSYYQGGVTADPTKWTNIIPITFAPYDTRINQTFGFAMSPFRDSEGNPIPPGDDIGGSYPWMDRKANNLFLETLGDRSKYFYFDTSTNSLATRYPFYTIPGDLSFAPMEDTGGKHQGMAFLGLWSHGKLVIVDNLNNDIDYAMGNSNQPQTRDVELFDSSTDPDPTHNKLRMGYGRATTRMPPGENGNGNIIDSPEARFTYRRHFQPLGLDDITWPITNGKHTDELGFDDYIDPDAILIVDMTGSLTFTKEPWNNQNTMHRFEYHDGWVHPDGGFHKPIRLQNGATGTKWQTPPYGVSHGPSRIEPAATGGVVGKGFWMTGNNGVSFLMPNQPPESTTSSDSPDLYAGIFVDCRHGDDHTLRRVLTFPDGTSIQLHGRRQVCYVDASGAVAHRITMPPVVSGALGDLLPYRGWAHLAVQVRNEGHMIDFCLNGMLFDRRETTNDPLFQMGPGAFTIGMLEHDGSPGMIGWVDELKVFAHTFDPETLCNHAAGTLIGLTPSYAGIWRTQFADRFPDWVHAELSGELRNRGEATFPAYACMHSYDTDHGGALDNLPPSTSSLRESMHFPEGPLYHNAPRPHSVQNRFCTNCHHASGKMGLGLGALTLNPSLTAAADPRRQPMQPAARIHGVIPAGLIDTASPPAPPTLQTTSTAGAPIDQWMLSTYSGPSTVQSATVIDPDSGRELFELQDQMTIDPAVWGLQTVHIRANLDSAQGSVTLQINNQPSIASLTPDHSLPFSLTAGTHTFSATPAGGTTTTLTFTVPSGARVLANYHDSFQHGSPASNWVYAWNANDDIGTPQDYRPIFWNPLQQHYNTRGLGNPDTTAPLAWGHLRASGGHPGRSSSQQGGHPERFVMAGYRVRTAGTYRVQNAFVRIPDAQSDGGRIVVMIHRASSVQTFYDTTFASGSPHTIPTQTITAAAGDVIYVAMGPSLTDTRDSFQWDFDIAIQ